MKGKDVCRGGVEGGMEGGMEGVDREQKLTRDERERRTWHVGVEVEGGEGEVENQRKPLNGRLIGRLSRAKASLQLLPCTNLIYCHA